MDHLQTAAGVHKDTTDLSSGTSPRVRFFFIGADPQSSATPGYNTPGPGKLTLHNLLLSGGRQRGGGSDSGGAGIDGAGDFGGGGSFPHPANAGGAGAGMGGAIFNHGCGWRRDLFAGLRRATAAGSAQTRLSLHNSILANTASGSDLTIDQPAISPRLRRWRRARIS